MNVVLPFAELMLRKERAFSPFGGRMSSDGKIAHVGASDGTEHPKPLDLIAILESGFRRDAGLGAIKACAMVVDMRVVPPGKTAKQDAIAVHLDHRDDYSVRVFFPYSFGFLGKLRVEPPFAAPGERRIFPA